MNKDHEPTAELDERQRRVVSWVIGGMPGPAAFRRAGFAPSYARKASKILRQPLWVSALEDARVGLRDSQGYGAEHAVQEINRQIKGALAAKTPNHMAAAKLLELKCKIFGLVREKVEVVSIDMKGALDEAKQRLIQINPAFQQLTEVQPVVSEEAEPVPARGAE
jgi:hypothetical protein